jgi:uncharacterized protein (TIGR00645 family)
MNPLGRTIFLSRWLQAPLYIGLILAQAIYVWQFWIEIIHLLQDIFSSSKHLGDAELMLIVLGLIDVVMISNLLVMVIVGGWEIFISRLRLDLHPDQPEWLSHVNAGILRVKLAVSIIGISSIHLLKTFINSSSLDGKVLFWQTTIHMILVLSAILIAWTEKITMGISPSLSKDKLVSKTQFVNSMDDIQLVDSSSFHPLKSSENHTSKKRIAA